MHFFFLLSWTALGVYSSLAGSFELDWFILELYPTERRSAALSCFNVGIVKEPITKRREVSNRLLFGHTKGDIQFLLFECRQPKTLAYARIRCKISIIANKFSESHNITPRVGCEYHSTSKSKWFICSTVFFVFSVTHVRPPSQTALILRKAVSPQHDQKGTQKNYKYEYKNEPHTDHTPLWFSKKQRILWKPWTTANCDSSSRTMLHMKWR